MTGFLRDEEIWVKFVGSREWVDASNKARVTELINETEDDGLHDALNDGSLFEDAKAFFFYDYPVSIAGENATVKAVITERASDGKFEWCAGTLSAEDTIEQAERKLYDM